jgi:hypothetical protein
MMIIKLIFVILILSIPGMIFTSNLAFGSNESSYIVGYWAGSNNGQGNSNSAPYDPSKCKLHPSAFWAKNDVEPAVTNQTSCKDGWLDGWKSWCLKNGQEAYNWYQTGAHQATGKNDCPITSNGAFCAA